MANEIRNAFNAVYADGPQSRPSQPDKRRIRDDVGQVIQDQVDTALSAAQASAEGYIIASTWAALAATNGTRAGQPGRVPVSDTGTHIDPVVGGNVSNSGEYRWNTAPAGWQRVGDMIDEKFSDLLRESRTRLFPAPVDTPTLSDDWTSVLLGDSAGNVEAGFDKFGSLWAQIATAPGVPALADDLLYAWVTEDGYLLFGFDSDGAFVSQGISAADLQVFEREVAVFPAFSP